MLKRVEARTPRLGFLGLGWIGRHRMEALASSGAAEVAALADADDAALEAAARIAPDAAPCAGLDEMLAAGLDGIVIATPSALHAPQAIAALEAGLAVFCQKPLGRTGDEAEQVVEAARRADRLLAVDLSYRHTAAFRALKAEIDGGGLGRPHALDLTFHNAYGPDKPWFRDRTLSGGGCLIDLGVHLVDAALWLTGSEGATCRSAAMFHQGRRLGPGEEDVEDLVYATLDLPGGAVARIACSWNLSAGNDAVIGAEIHGVGAGAILRNVGGSFFDFEAHRTRGTARESLSAPPDDWGGRAAVAWARALAMDPGFDPAAEGLVRLARTLDAIYAAA
ncbi:Gfo/Idh/MocA family protein [Wenxinia marina]|uniref:Putative dehydrogenase n=1 Tax=Wenxinia marina DSM 24838 TaxID=1123501 RepID=A0A0D0Q0K2_9RHOB|nr:Gfo/Idh/MocA family oxidoreductase [Wenxinia marina]KIQ68094.1 putative dehydrogenase [Wenxinia marina DSM 24838]GGL78177.1 oxidoreductase [Wenxinia marina]